MTSARLTTLQAQKILDSYVDEEGEGFPFTVQLFSALKRIGIDEADAKITELLGLDDEDEAGLAAEPDDAQ